MSETRFPSGPWKGYYNYRAGGRQHRMVMNLAFAGGVMTGDGQDDIGSFGIRGRYDPGTGDCHWTKSYAGAHDVFYTGFREEKGIWGTWEISQAARGGFHIWPHGAGESDAEVRAATEEAIADAVAPNADVSAGFPDVR